MRHIVNMSAAGAIGLAAIFFVDLLNLFYISLLGDPVLTAAVGYASTVFMINISMCIGFTIAGTAIVARATGSGDDVLSKQNAASALIYMGLLNIAMVLVLYPSLGWLLGILGAKDKAYDVALAFTQVVVPSIPLVGFGIACSGVIRALGDARRSMYITLSAGIVTAIVDPIMIFHFEYGVMGAAYAVLFARASLVLTGIYGVWIVHRHLTMPTLANLRTNATPFLAIAIPALMTQVATPFGNGVVTAYISQFGDSAVAGWTIIGRILPLAFAGLYTLSGAVGPILGQNYGAGQIDRVRATMWESLKFSLIYTLIVWVVLAFGADMLISIFDASGEAADLVYFFCYIFAGSFVFQSALFVANAAFNNLGYPFYSTFFNWARATLGTFPLIYLALPWGAQGVIAGFSIGGVLFGVASIIVCLRIIEKLPDKKPEKIVQSHA